MQESFVSLLDDVSILLYAHVRFLSSGEVAKLLVESRKVCFALNDRRISRVAIRSSLIMISSQSAPSEVTAGECQSHRRSRYRPPEPKPQLAFLPPRLTANLCDPEA